MIQQRIQKQPLDLCWQSSRAFVMDRVAAGRIADILAARTYPCISRRSFRSGKKQMSPEKNISTLSMTLPVTACGSAQNPLRVGYPPSLFVIMAQFLLLFFLGYYTHT
jgi:hypothetical protein